MLLTISIVLAILLAINVMLLIFSCNKTTKAVTKTEKVKALKPEASTNQSQVPYFPATGS